MFGVPHPDLGEEVMAVVVVEGDHRGALQEQLRDGGFVRRAEPLVACRENPAGQPDREGRQGGAQGGVRAEAARQPGQSD